jgi:hypothetical protein
MTRFARSALLFPLACSLLAALGAACSSSGGGDSAAQVTAGITGGTAPEPRAPQEAELVDVPLVPSSVIKTARLSIEVGEDGFTAAADRATAIAGEQGGFVESSSSQGSDLRSGRLTLRVPVDRFEEALSEVSKLGEVRLRSVSGKDVTSRFVDLDARIRNARAQEEVLLGILDQAGTVSATLQVQRTLSDVQLQIEELVGQERSLRNRAAFGTIAVDLFERGADQPIAAGSDISNPRLSEAWVRAKATFFALVYGIIVSASVLVPLGLVALFALFVARRVRERRMRPAHADPQAPAEA